MITGVVLCGGSARRFHGRDKPLVKLAGRPMIEHVLERLAGQVDEIVISANRRIGDYQAYGYPVIADEVPDQGPLAGVAAAAGITRGELLVVCPADAPCLPLGLVAALHACMDGVDAVVASDGQRDQPLFLLLRSSSTETIPDYLAAGGRSVHGWLAGMSVARCVMDEPDAFININSPEELAALDRRLRG